MDLDFPEPHSFGFTDLSLVSKLLAMVNRSLFVFLELVNISSKILPISNFEC